MAADRTMGRHGAGSAAGNRTRGGPDGEGVPVASIELTMFRRPTAVAAVPANAVTAPLDQPLRARPLVSRRLPGARNSRAGLLEEQPAATCGPLRDPAVGTNSVCAGQAPADGESPRVSWRLG